MSDDTPRPSGGRGAPRASGARRRGVTGSTPRSITLIVAVTLVAVLAGTVMAFPSYAARGPRTAAVDTDVIPAATPSWRGCRPPRPTPTPKPTPTPSPSPSPSAAPSGPPDSAPAASPDASASPKPSPKPTVKPRVTPTPYLPPGIDVSVYQGSLNWSLIKASGMKFAIIRATAGQATVDTRFAQHVARARANGMLIGAYHFFDYRGNGRKQADLFIDTAAANGLLTDALPLAVDIECLGSYGWSVWATAVPELRRFVNRVYERTGRKPILYTSKTMWRQVMGNAKGFGDLPLWVACWRCSKPYLPVGWKSWRFWQIRPYKIPGIAKKVDGNVFRGTDESLLLWRGQPMVIDGGAKVTGDLLVTVELGSVGGVEVRTRDDRSDWTDWRPLVKPVQHQLADGPDGQRTVSAQARRADTLEGPVVADTIVVDRTAPQVGPPTVVLRQARIGSKGRVPVTATWKVKDTVAGVAGSTLIHDCGNGLVGESLAGGASAASIGKDGRLRVRVAGAASSSTVDGSVAAGSCQLSARAVDAVGNLSDPSDRTTATVTVIDDVVAFPAARRAWWSTRTRGGAVGGTVLRTTTRGAALKTTVTGDSLGIVATKGPGRGRLRVLLDGVVIRVVDLYQPKVSARQVVLAVPLPKGGTHTLKLVVERRANPRSHGRQVEVDALVTARNQLPGAGVKAPRAPADGGAGADAATGPSAAPSPAP